VSRYILEQTPLKLIVYDPRSDRFETVTDLSILDRIKVSTHVRLQRARHRQCVLGKPCSQHECERCAPHFLKEIETNVRPPPGTEGTAAASFALAKRISLGEEADGKISAGPAGLRGDRDHVAGAGTERRLGFGSRDPHYRRSAGDALHPVLEVATFYTMFQLQPVGRKAHIQVCGTTPCRLRGAADLIDVCQHRIHHDPFQLSKDGDFSWEEVECLGACVNAPMALIWSDTYEDLTRQSFGKLLDGFASGNPPKPGPQNGRAILRADRRADHAEEWRRVRHLGFAEGAGSRRCRVQETR